MDRNEKELGRSTCDKSVGEVVIEAFKQWVIGVRSFNVRRQQVQNIRKTGTPGTVLEGQWQTRAIYQE